MFVDWNVEVGVVDVDEVFPEGCDHHGTLLKQFFIKEMHLQKHYKFIYPNTTGT